MWEGVPIIMLVILGTDGATADTSAALVRMDIMAVQDLAIMDDTAIITD